MTKNNIPIGTRFGLLTVLCPSDRHSGYNQYFHVRCDCGREIEVQGSHLLYSHKRTCGCKSDKQPREQEYSRRRLRQTWRHMIDRCINRRCKDYGNYGARGIAIHPDWFFDYSAFQVWALSHGYRDDLSLDRTDNNGPYEPENCRWATITEQNRNTRRVRRCTAFGETKTLSEWADDPRCHVSYFTLRQRVVYLKWEFEAALLCKKHERLRTHAA